jgi:hypothetical protein
MSAALRTRREALGPPHSDQDAFPGIQGPRTPQIDVQARAGRCRGCLNRWTAPAACHCATCHQTFADVDAFDAHGCLQ